MQLSPELERRQALQCGFPATDYSFLAEEAKPVNPLKHIGETLWCVYGPDCFPTIICCRLLISPLDKTREPAIWGYSVYKKEPGFRTLGQDYSKWAKKAINPKFYTDQASALSHLAKITTPQE